MAVVEEEDPILRRFLMMDPRILSQQQHDDCYLLFIYTGTFKSALERLQQLQHLQLLRPGLSWYIAAKDLRDISDLLYKMQLAPRQLCTRRNCLVQEIEAIEAMDAPEVKMDEALNQQLSHHFRAPPQLQLAEGLPLADVPLAPLSPAEKLELFNSMSENYFNFEQQQKKEVERRLGRFKKKLEQDLVCAKQLVVVDLELVFAKEIPRYNLFFGD